LTGGEIVSFTIGALATLFVGLPMRHFLSAMADLGSVQGPTGISQERWRESIEVGDRVRRGALWLGFFERLLFYCAFVFTLEVVVAAWLAFKVASKWESWQTIVKVPDSLEGIDDLDFLAARNRWGTIITHRWLLGVLLNGLCAAIGYFASVLARQN
jgi:hypothetical protein